MEAFHKIKVGKDAEEEFMLEIMNTLKHRCRHTHVCSMPACTHTHKIYLDNIHNNMSMWNCVYCMCSYFCLERTKYTKHFSWPVLLFGHINRLGQDYVRRNVII